MEKGNWLSRLLRHAAPIGLFVFLPLLVAAYLGYHTIALEREKHVDGLAQSLETSLTQITCESDAEVFLKKVARGAWHAVNRAGGDQGRLLKYYQALQGFLPTEFDLYAFNSAGELITPASLPLRSRFMGSRLWEIINCTPLEQNRRFQRLRKSLITFLGNEFRIAQFLDGRDSTVPIITRQQHGRIYWFNDPASPGAGILMIFWTIPELDFRLSQVISRMNGRFAAGFVAADDSEQRGFGTSQVASSTAGDIFRAIAVLDQKYRMDEQERLWAGQRVENLWVMAAIQASTADYVRWHSLLLGALVLAAVTGIGLYIRAAGSGALYLSIRLKLLALFLTAVISPIMGFAYLGYRYLDDRTQTLLATVGNQSRQLLFGFDESLKNTGASFIDDFRSLSRKIADIDNQQRRRELEAKIESNDLISIELRDTVKAGIIYALQNELVFEGMREVSDAFARYCIDNRLGSSLKDAIDPVLNMVVLSPEAGMQFFFVRPEEVHQMSFGPVPLYIFWNIFQDVAGRQVYVYIVQSAARLLKKLVERKLHAAAADGRHKPFMLAAMSNRTGEWVPGRVRGAADLRDFAGRAVFSDKPVEIRLKIAGEDYVAVGQKGKYAKNYSFFAFYPYRLIEHEIAGLRRSILAGILLFTVVALLAGWLLSDVFLVPVARLGEGVAAIKNRNSEFRIEAGQQDEFGDLAVSFNHMIADLKEMQLARDVQESLLPSAPPVIDGYGVSFANRMASAVGGDYFDVHVLDQDHVCVIVGDVTGHGVSSALVMAMARAIVYQGLKESRNLIELFSDLNRAIYAYFSRPPIRRMITLFAAIIDLPTGRGEFANAGHNFPIKVSAGGRCEDLSSIHLPIGALPVLRKLTGVDFSIAHGDTLVFYTDGLIEVTNPRGEQYGYERLRNMLAENCDQQPAELSQRLMVAYDAWRAGSEPDDDVTLIILRRQADVLPG